MTAGTQRLDAHRDPQTSQLDRTVERGRLLRPGYLECEKGRLYSSYSSAAEVAQPSNLFESFLELGTATDTAIRDFAREWGSLGICRHGVPWLHTVLQPHRSPCRPLRARWRERDGNHVNVEDTSAWRSLALAFVAMLEVAEHLRENRPGPKKAWDCIRGFAERLYGPSEWTIGLRDGSHSEGQYGTDEVPLQRYTFAQLLTALGDAALVMIDVEWGPSVAEAPRLLLGSGTLFGAIVVQAIQVCSSVRGLVKCSGGPHWYSPVDKHGHPRWPQAGRRHFCPRCRAEGVPVKLAQRDKRGRDLRRRQGKELGHGKASRKS